MLQSDIFVDFNTFLLQTYYLIHLIQDVAISAQAFKQRPVQSRFFLHFVTRRPCFAAFSAVVIILFPLQPIPHLARQRRTLRTRAGCRSPLEFPTCPQ